jgi:peptide/nickel transport system permease protein
MRAGLAIGGALTAGMLVLAALSLVWTPYPPTAIDIIHRLSRPSAAHWFGTDPFGRDVFSMVMVGTQDAVAVAALAVLLGTAIGVPAGMLAATRGGWTDETVMRGADLTFAFPAVLTAVMLTALRGAGAITEIIAIGVFTAPVLARTTRGAAAAIWVQDYARAARALGRTRRGVALVHVLPNILGLLIVQVTIQLSLAVLAEAGLSFVGLGAQPPAPSWGRMLNEAQTYIYTAPLRFLASICWATVCATASTQGEGDRPNEARRVDGGENPSGAGARRDDGRSDPPTGSR